jgi:hypothetical protein
MDSTDQLPEKTEGGGTPGDGTTSAESTTDAESTADAGATTEPDGTTEAGDTSEPEGKPEGTTEAADLPKPRTDEAPAPSEEDRWAAFAPVPSRIPGRLRRVGAATGRFLAHEWTLAAIGSLALAAIMKWPTLRHPQYTLPQDLGDPTLVSWLLAWPGHILLTNYDQLWHGNAFFPDRWSYAFTDSLLGYAPAGMLGDGPLAAALRYNILFVLVHALAFFGAYVLARQLGVDRIAALVPALAFAYAPWRLTQAGHLQVLSTGGIALALAMLARGHGWTLRWGFKPRKVRPGWIVAGWLVAAWQITLGFGIGLLFGYVLAGIVLAVAVAWLVRRVLRKKRHRIGRILAANLVGGTIFGAVTVLMALPYLVVVEQHPNARRPFEALFSFSPPPRGFLTAPAESWLWGGAHEGARQLLSWTPEMTLLPGFALLGLAVAGLVYSVWSMWTRALLAAGVVAGVILAMGTEFLDGSVYRVLYDWLPGWDALRTSGRLIIWVTLLLGVLAAGAVTALLSGAKDLALDRGFPRPGPWLKLVALIPVILILVEGIGTTPQPVVPRQPTAMTVVDGPVMVLPSDQLTDSLVMLWSTDRYLPMVNGGSGFTPAGQQETRQITQTFPDQASVSHLRSIGVVTVVVLPDRVVGTPWEPALSATGDGLGITREEIDGVIVFHLLGP